MYNKAGFRIRIGSGSRRAIMTHKSRNAGCFLLRAEVFFCNLDVLYGGLGIGTFKFFFQLYLFLIFGHKKPGSKLIFSVKCWIRIRIKWIRIRNPEQRPLACKWKNIWNIEWQLRRKLLPGGARSEDLPLRVLGMTSPQTHPVQPRVLQQHGLVPSEHKKKKNLSMKNKQFINQRNIQDLTY